MTVIRLVFFNDRGGCDGCGGFNGDFNGYVLLIMDIEYLNLLVRCPSPAVTLSFDDELVWNDVGHW